MRDELEQLLLMERRQAPAQPWSERQLVEKS
jgi:hypothetical protein